MNNLEDAIRDILNNSDSNGMTPGEVLGELEAQEGPGVSLMNVSIAEITNIVNSIRNTDF